MGIINKKTHNEYIKQVEKINPNIKVIGKYIRTNIKIKHKCLIDGHIWEVLPHSIIRGVGCPKCSGRDRKTHERYIKEVKKINPNIEVLEEYTRADTKIKHKCLIDGHVWNPRPNSVLRGSGCPKCSIKKRTKMKDIDIIIKYIKKEKKKL